VEPHDAILGCTRAILNDLKDRAKKTSFKLNWRARSVYIGFIKLLAEVKAIKVVAWQEHSA
jgi:hypothetical protein